MVNTESCTILSMTSYKLDNFYFTCKRTKLFGWIYGVYFYSSGTKTLEIKFWCLKHVVDLFIQLPSTLLKEIKYSLWIHVRVSLILSHN